MSLENVVRPFQLPQNTLPGRIESPSERDAPIVRLNIGLGGVGKLMSGSFSKTVTSYCIAFQVEQRDG